MTPRRRRSPGIRSVQPVLIGRGGSPSGGRGGPLRDGSFSPSTLLPGLFLIGWMLASMRGGEVRVSALEWRSVRSNGDPRYRFLSQPLARGVAGRGDRLAWISVAAAPRENVPALGVPRPRCDLGRLAPADRPLRGVRGRGIGGGGGADHLPAPPVRPVHMVLLGLQGQPARRPASSHIAERHGGSRPLALRKRSDGPFRLDGDRGSDRFAAESRVPRKWCVGRMRDGAREKPAELGTSRIPTRDYNGVSNKE